MIFFLAPEVRPEGGKVKKDTGRKGQETET